MGCKRQGQDVSKLRAMVVRWTDRLALFVIVPYSNVGVPTSEVFECLGTRVWMTVIYLIMIEFPNGFAFLLKF